MKGAKYKLITAAMAAVSLTVAFGGWFLTKELLDRKNAEFLNGTGAVALRSGQTALLTQEQADEAARAFKKHEIPEKQMREILLLWDYGVKEMPHDPKEAQMNMEQAIETGKQWIATLANREIVPKTLVDGDFDRITAQLGTVEIQTELDERLLSRWMLEYRKDDVDINLTIHAMSGEIWYANISMMAYSSLAYAYSSAEMMALMFPREKRSVVDTIDMYDGHLIKVLEEGAVSAHLNFQTVDVDLTPSYVISLWLEPMNSYYE